MALHMWSCWLRRSFPKILAAIISAAAMKRYLGTMTWVPLLGLFPFACLGKVSRGPGTRASITFRAQPGAKINGVFAVGGWLVAVSSDGYMAHKCMCYAWVFVPRRRGAKGGGGDSTYCSGHASRALPRTGRDGTGHGRHEHFPDGRVATRYIKMSRSVELVK